MTLMSGVRLGGSQEMQYAHEMQWQDWTRIGDEPTGDQNSRGGKERGGDSRQFGLARCKRLHGFANQDLLAGHRPME